jgi:hypothetical protein
MRIVSADRQQTTGTMKTGRDGKFTQQFDLRENDAKKHPERGWSKFMSYHHTT